MATFRRDTTPGATWFFTVVTAGRRPWLAERRAIDCLKRAVACVRSASPFEIVAAAVMPDHMHMIWTLPANDGDYARRWGLIKVIAAREMRSSGAIVPIARAASCRRHESGLWQRRFWEHRIRDEDDLARHVDYIHFNPVHHGLAPRAVDWPHSSFHAYVRRGRLAVDWAADATIAHERAGE